MIADGARGEFHTVANDVVLDRLERKNFLVIRWMERKKFIDSNIRHRERIVGEVDLLLLLIPLVHRKIDDPAELEPVLIDQAKFVANFCPRRAGKFDKILRLAGDKEYCIAVFQAELRAELFGALWAKNSLRLGRPLQDASLLQ